MSKRFSNSWWRAERAAAIVAACASSAVVAAMAVPAAADALDGLVNPASAMHVSAARLAFAGLGQANARTFMVSEHGYTRTFNAASRTCGEGARAIARFSPDAHAGPAATFTVTPLNPGYCTVTISDDGSGSVRVQVDVEPAAAPSPVPSVR